MGYEKERKKRNYWEDGDSYIEDLFLDESFVETSPWIQSEEERKMV